MISTEIGMEVINTSHLYTFLIYNYKLHASSNAIMTWSSRGILITYSCKYLDSVNSSVSNSSRVGSGRRVDVPSTAVLGARQRCLRPQAAH